VFPQVIQTVSAVDKDDPIQGHYFEYRLIPEMLNNPNFTIKNNGGKGRTCDLE
jgi:cadherin 11 type 2 (OB-cadherin)